MPDSLSDAPDWQPPQDDVAGDPAGPALAEDAGQTVVPLKPTAEMLAAGTRAGEVSVAVAWRVYQAMVSEGTQHTADPRPSPIAADPSPSKNSP